MSQSCLLFYRMPWSAIMGVDLLNVRGLRELEHQAPVVMVNLMRFRERSLDGDGSGWDAYLRYSAFTVPMIKARGGTLLWTGDAKAVALGAAGRQPMGLSGAGILSRCRRVHRHDDLARLRTALRSAPHQRLRRACDRRDGRGVQQVQDGVGDGHAKSFHPALPAGGVVDGRPLGCAFRTQVGHCGTSEKCQKQKTERAQLTQGAISSGENSLEIFDRCRLLSAYVALHSL